MFPGRAAATAGRRPRRCISTPARAVAGRQLRLQRHIDIAVAHNAWSYYQVTGDVEFLRFRGRR